MYCCEYCCEYSVYHSHSHCHSYNNTTTTTTAAAAATFSTYSIATTTTTATATPTTVSSFCHQSNCRGPTAPKTPKPESLCLKPPALSLSYHNRHLYYVIWFPYHGDLKPRASTLNPKEGTISEKIFASMRSGAILRALERAERLVWDFGALLLRCFLGCRIEIYGFMLRVLRVQV